MKLYGNPASPIRPEVPSFILTYLKSCINYSLGDIVNIQIDFFIQLVDLLCHVALYCIVLCCVMLRCVNLSFLIENLNFLSFLIYKLIKVVTYLDNIVCYVFMC